MLLREIATTLNAHYASLSPWRSAFYSDEHVVVLRALIREKFMKVAGVTCVH